MKEVVYKYSNLGRYYTEDTTAFDEEREMKFLVEPHDFGISIGGETLRKSSFEGCVILLSDEGEVSFFVNSREIGKAEKGEGRYEEAIFLWNKESIEVQFGMTATVDNYPNCDGEFDRYTTQWLARRTVTLNLANKTIDIK